MLSPKAGAVLEPEHRRRGHRGCALGELASPGPPRRRAGRQRDGLLREPGPRPRYGPPHPPVPAARDRAVVHPVPRAVAERGRRALQHPLQEQVPGVGPGPRLPGVAARQSRLRGAAQQSVSLHATPRANAARGARLAGHPLAFPARECPPQVALPKPEAGRYDLVRFIRSDRDLDIFGERFLVPPEAEYAYVVATIDVARQRLTVRLDGDLIAEWPYRLR